MKTLEELAREFCWDKSCIWAYESILKILKQVREQALEEAEKIVERVSLKYTDDITGRAGETIQAIRTLREKS